MFALLAFWLSDNFFSLLQNENGMRLMQPKSVWFFLIPMIFSLRFGLTLENTNIQDTFITISYKHSISI
jgi:hypothetical protein